MRNPHTEKIFILMKFVYFFFCWSWLLVLYLRTSAKSTITEDLLIFLLRIVWLLPLYLGIDPFWVNFCMWHEVGILPHSFACGCPVSPAPFVENTALSSLNGFGTLVENQSGFINVWVYFWTLSSIPMVCMSILMPVSHCSNYCSFGFEIGKYSFVNLRINFSIL